MAKTVRTYLQYRVAYGSDESADLEAIIELTSHLKEAREQAAASCRDVEVSVGIYGGAVDAYYEVTLAAPDKVRLQDALKLFFREGGLPASLYGESRVAEELLVPYGKRLKADVFGEDLIVDA